MMLPAMIFPILFSLAGIIFITIIPVGITVATFIAATDLAASMNFHDSAILLGIWVVGCAVTGVKKFCFHFILHYLFARYKSLILNISAVASYITVVQYSVFKSVDYSQRNKSRLQSTRMNAI